MTPLSRYTCEEAFRRLDDYLDRELSSDETELVREHLEVCAGGAREGTLGVPACAFGVRRAARRGSP
jgi:hypothetical protein